MHYQVRTRDCQTIGVDHLPGCDYRTGCRCENCAQANTNAAWLTRRRKRARKQLGESITKLGEDVDVLHARLSEILDAEDQRHRRRSGQSRLEVRTMLVRLEAVQQRLEIEVLRAHTGLGD